MGEYVSAYGVTRQVGRGEGIDEKYGVSAKPALGERKFLEVVVDEKGPAANKGTGYGRDGQYVPGGSVVVSATLFVQTKGDAANVTIGLVKKDGTDTKALLAATTPASDGTIAIAAGAALNTLLAEDRYFTSGGTKTGLKATLLVEYI